MSDYLIDSILELEKKGEVSFDIKGHEKFMGYNGNIRQCLNKTRAALKDDNPLDQFLYANRILSGVIDYALKTKAPIFELKRDIEKLCTRIYEGEKDVALGMIDTLNLPKELLDARVKEEEDKYSWTSFNPKLSYNLIQKMDKDKFQPDYIVLDGHDAYRPGLMVASYLENNIWAIRNTQDSKIDTKPMPISGEEEELREKLHGKHVLLLGEDSSTGRALKGLHNLVSRLGVYNVKTAANISIPGKGRKIPLDYFGEERTCFS